MAAHPCNTHTHCYLNVHTPVKVRCCGCFLSCSGTHAPAWFTSDCIPSTADTAGRSPARLWYPAVQLYLFKPLPSVVPPSLLAVCEQLRTQAAGANGCPSSVAVHVRRGDTVEVPYRTYVRGATDGDIDGCTTEPSRLAGPWNSGQASMVAFSVLCNTSFERAVCHALACSAIRHLSVQCTMHWRWARLGESGIGSSTYVRVWTCSHDCSTAARVVGAGRGTGRGTAPSSPTP